MAWLRWRCFITDRELPDALADIQQALDVVFLGVRTSPDESPPEIFDLTDRDRLTQYRRIYACIDHAALDHFEPEEDNLGFDWLRIDLPRNHENKSLTLTEISIDSGKASDPGGHHPEREMFFRQVKRILGKRAHLQVFWVYLNIKKLGKTPSFRCSDEIRRFVAGGGKLLAYAGSMSIAHPYSILTPDPPDYPFLEKPAAKKKKTIKEQRHG